MVEFFEMLKPSGFGESRRLFVLRLSGVCFARFEFSKMLSFQPAASKARRAFYLPRARILSASFMPAVTACWASLFRSTTSL
jgi:hypothetical protein